MNTLGDKLTVRQFRPVAALMMGYAFLMFAGGLNSLIIPIRGHLEGFSAFSIGLMGTSWAVGFIFGSLYVPKLVARSGHVRVFGVMASLATIAVIASALFVDPIAWVPLRAAAGFCFAGAAMIVEAWLNESANKSNRGRIFGIYTMVNLVATTAGQMIIVTGDTTNIVFFLVAAIFYTLAIIPPALSEQTKPRSLKKVTFHLPVLWKNSPVAVVGITLVGMSNSAFGSLGAVFAQQIGLDIAIVATFMSMAIVCGALVQIPVGYLSDRFDRRTVLLMLTVIAACLDIYFIRTGEFTITIVLIAGAFFGGSIYSLPPVIVAHANDLARKDHYVQTSSGLLLLFGLGAIAGPFVAGALMTLIDERALFMTTLWAHLTLVIYIVWRMMRRRGVERDRKSSFSRIEPGRVILQAPALSSRDFGIDAEQNHNAPVIPNHILSHFDRVIEDDDATEVNRNRPGDDTHGGW